MGLFDFFKGKVAQKKEFSDEDRANSLEKRRLLAEMNKTQHEIEMAHKKIELRELQEELNNITNNTYEASENEEDSETKNLTIYKDCTFEDKRTYNYYNNCTFNTYIIKRGKDKEDSEWTVFEEWVDSKDI